MKPIFLEADRGSIGTALRPATIALGALALMALAQLHLTLTRSINWDEYHFIEQVYLFARGELTAPLNTIHVRLFQWLPSLGGSTVDQIVAGRLVMFAALALTVAMIVLVAQRFVPSELALICGLAYLSFGFVVQHGTAFRVDPLATSLAMTGLAILVRARLTMTAIAAAALALALAFSVTIKIVLLAPAFAGIAWLRWSQDDFSADAALRIAAIAMAAAAVAGLIYLWHGAELASVDDAARVVGNAGAHMFALVPQPHYIIKAITLSPAFTIIAVLAIRQLARAEGFPPAQRIALAGLVAPLATLVFYTNSFPYFYPFLLPPVCAGLAAGLPSIARRFHFAAIAGVFVLCGAVTWAIDGPSRQPEQRAIEQGVDMLFPEPVAYFDFPGSLPRHEKANFFMTTWGVKLYQERGQPEFLAAMLERPVPLLLTSELRINPYLLAVMEGSARSQAFHRDDVIALRTTYRRWWGPIWVAGREVEAGETITWDVLVPGTYSVEGRLLVNGQRKTTGNRVSLARGKVTLEAIGESDAGLIYGTNPQRPVMAEPARPYWTDF
jgi:hypothetical protein